MSTDVSRLLDEAHAVLLDFDGPITLLMPPPTNSHAADAARLPLAGLDTPADLTTTSDHLP